MPIGERSATVDGRLASAAERAPTVRRQVPRSLAEQRMVRVLRVGQQLVAEAARSEDLLARALLEQAGDRAAPRRVDLDPIVLVLDGRALDRGPARTSRSVGGRAAARYVR